MKHLLLFLLCCFLCTAGLYAQVRPTANPVADRTEVRVFPNPADSFLELNDNDRVHEIAVFNLAGRQVRSYFYTKGERYFIGDLPRGMYLVQLLDHRKKVITTQRINKL